MTGYRPSEATLLHYLNTYHEKLEPIETYIQQEILKSDVLPADETGMRIENQTQWLHTVSSSNWTLYHVHEKRGKEAINDHGILPSYEGILVHDCWASYFTTDYSFDHALCGNARGSSTMMATSGRQICKTSFWKYGQRPSRPEKQRFQ